MAIDTNMQNEQESIERQGEVTEKTYADQQTETPPAPKVDKRDGDADSQPSTASIETLKATVAKYPMAKTFAIVGGALVLICVLFATHVICPHRWTDATCVNPKTCEFCGRTEGNELGHSWSQATCTRPKRCTRCYKTESSALGHDWQDATCTEPKTCKRCSIKEGKPLGHEISGWATIKDATCTETGERQGTCVKCGETVAEPIDKLNHTAGGWEVAQDYSITAYGTVKPGKRVRRCVACGAELESQAYTITLTMGQRNAMSEAQSYLNYTSFSYSGLVEQLEYEGYSHEDATFAVDHCGADWNEQAAKEARSYLDYSSFSRDGLIDQLMFEGYTREQAEYGVSAVGY